MIDFREEISKYKPLVSIDDVEVAVQTDEVRDVMDLLQYIAKQVSTERE